MGIIICESRAEYILSEEFNVQGSNLYKHQYMGNIQGAASEAAKLSQAYTADLKRQPWNSISCI